MKKVIAWWARLSEESKTTFVVILGIPMLVAWVIFAAWSLLSTARAIVTSRSSARWTWEFSIGGGEVRVRWFMPGLSASRTQRLKAILRKIMQDRKIGKTALVGLQDPIVAT